MLLAVGFLVVLLDLRLSPLGNLDLLFDPAGWVVVVVAMSRLNAVDARARPALVAAVCAGILSLSTLVPPEPTPAGTPAGITVRPLSDPGVLVGLAYDMALTVGAVLLCMLLSVRAREAGELVPAQRFWTLAWALALAELLAVVLGVPISSSGVAAGPGLSPVAVPVVLVALVGFAVSVWFVVELFRTAHASWRTTPPLQPA